LLGLASIVSLASVSACGLYTNVPAQIHIVDIKGGTVTYGNTTNDSREVTVVAPEITLAGEPGSIGATIESIQVDYVTTDGKTLVPTNKVPGMNLRMSIRVESSNFPTDPMAGPLTQASVGQTVAIGKATVSLPVITRHVIAYGADATVNLASVTAQFHMQGTDDAGFPVDLTAYAPITFLGPPTGTKI
jgi:hypothetical protein